MSTTTAADHGLRRRTLAWLAVAALLAVSIVAATTTAAHADDHWDFDSAWLYPQLEEGEPFEDEVPTFYFGIEDESGAECELDVVVYPYPVTDLDDPQPIETTVVVEELEENFGLMSFPDLAAGWYDIQVASCIPANGFEGSEIALFAMEGFGFAILEINKEVEGDAPEDATFVVEVACTYTDDEIDWSLEDTYEREFGAEGGSAEVVLYPEFDFVDITCEVDETDDGGADSSTIEGAEVVILGEELYDFEADEFDTDQMSHTTTVINTFPEAEVDDEDDEDEDEDDEDDDEDEPEAEPAEAVVAQPDYTG